MNLAYNCNGLRTVGIMEAVERLSSIGYKGIELSLHERHIHPFFITDPELSALKEKMEECMITPVCLSTGAANLLSGIQHEPSLITPSAFGRRTRLSLLREAVRIAQMLDIPVVNFASGYHNPAVSELQAQQYLLDGIRELSRSAGDVILAIEPEPGMFVQTTTQAISLIQMAEVPNLRLNTDLGHIACCEDRLVPRLKEALRYTAHMHIEDIKDRTHRHLVPGRGDIPWNEVFEVLRGYDGYLSVELYDYDHMPYQAMQDSLDYLKQFEG